MDGTAYRDYFLQPWEVGQRRYEALRAVIVERQPMQVAAERFGFSYGTVRNWVGEFRRLRDANQRPPFSRPRRAAAQRSLPRRTSQKSPWPMSKRCPWKQDGG